METNTLEREGMRFIINGRTFDTASSSPLAVSRDILVPRLGVRPLDHFYEGDWDQVRIEATLYRTQKGSLFIHDHATIKFPKGKPVVQDRAWEVTPDEAVKWIVEEGAAILDGTGLQLPDEA